MGKLDGFVGVVEHVKKQVYLQIIGSSFVVSKAASEMLKGEKLELRYNEKTLQVAVIGGDVGVKRKNSVTYLSSVNLRNLLLEKLPRSSFYEVREYEYSEEDNAIIFDLNKAKEFKR